MMDAADCDALSAWDPCSSSARVLRYPRVTSTQDVARRLICRGHAGIAAVIAGHQTAGRGRYGRAWVAPPGTCLLATYPVPLPHQSPEFLSMLPLAAGVCVALAVEELTGLAAGLKWPNDVLLSQRKAAGVLVEVAAGGDRHTAALVGIGINVNVERFPGELDASATSLLKETGRPWNVDELEALLRRHLYREVRLLHKDGPARVLACWRQRDQTTGRRYAIAPAAGGLEGEAVGVSHTGALIVSLADGTCVEIASASAVAPARTAFGGAG